MYDVAKWGLFGHLGSHCSYLEFLYGPFEPLYGQSGFFDCHLWYPRFYQEKISYFVRQELSSRNMDIRRFSLKIKLSIEWQLSQVPFGRF